MHNARDVLEDMTRRNYFTVRHAVKQGNAYEYHPLFREFLRTVAQRHYTPEDLTHLQRRAAAASETLGNSEDAAQLWIDACAPEELSHYLYREAPVLLAQGRGLLLAAWIGAVPAVRREQDPWLYFWLGQCRLPYAPSEARAHFDAALKLFETRNERTGALLAWTGLVDVSVHEGRDLDALDRLIAVFPRLAGSEALPRAIEDHVVVRMFSALVLRQLHHPDLALWRKRTYAILQSSVDPNLRVLAGVYLCIYFSWSGDVGRARQSLDWLTSVARTPDTGIPPLLLLLVSATEALHAWLVEADCRLSLEIVEKAHAYGEQVGISIWEHHLFGHAAAAALADGDTVGARQLLRRLADGIGQARLLDVGYYHFLAAWDALQRGDLAAAEAHRAAVEVQSASIGLAFGYALLVLLNARVHIERGEYAAARSWLDQGQRIAADTQSCLIEFAIALDEADLALRTDDESALYRWLTRAFVLGRTHGLTNFHGWRPLRMALLCARALALEIEVEYVQELIRCRHLEPPALQVPPESWPFPVKLHVLGRFSVVVNDQPMAYSLSHKKPFDLLQAQVVFGAHKVPAERLTEALWPEAEGDAAHQALKINVHRLRKLLPEGVILWSEGQLTLDVRRVWVDLQVLEGELHHLEEISTTDPQRDQTSRIHRIFSLHRHGLLPGNSQHWTLAVRERLHNRTLRLIARAIEPLESLDPAATAVIYEKAIELDPLREALYQGLIRCHQQSHQPAEGLRIYQRCRDILQRELGLTPSPATEALHQLLKAGLH